MPNGSNFFRCCRFFVYPDSDRQLKICRKLPESNAAVSSPIPSDPGPNSTSLPYSAQRSLADNLADKPTARAKQA